MTSTTQLGFWSCKHTSGLTPVIARCIDCPGSCEFKPVGFLQVGGGRLTSFQEEWAAARDSAPVSEQWLEGLLAHKDEGPIGDGAARDLLREVLRLRQVVACDCRDYTGLKLTVISKDQVDAIFTDTKPVTINFENPLPAPRVGNATIHTFKSSGKWYAEGRAKIAKELFEGLNNGSRRAWILTNNGEKCPGLSSRGETMIWVVLPDEDVDYGFPLLLRPIGD